MRRLLYISIIFMVSMTMAMAGHDPNNHIVINEVQTVGPNSHMDEFVELFNVTGDRFDISGHHLVYYWGDGSTNDAPLTLLSDGRYYRVLYTFPRNSHIEPYHYFLLTSPEYSADKAPDAIMDHNIFSNGQLLLVDSTLTDTLDAVAWGICDSVLTNEGEPAEYLEPHTGVPVSPMVDSLPVWSIQRLPEGTDTNDNFADFEMRNFSTPNNSGDLIRLMLDRSFRHYRPQSDMLAFFWKTLRRTKELHYTIQQQKGDDAVWSTMEANYSVNFTTKLDTNYFELILNDVDPEIDCSYRIKEADFTDQVRYSKTINVNAQDPIAIDDGDDSNEPDAFTLYPNFPNPFNSKTIIRYE
ncbi:lamin tail domain-containing protein, partial [candidate division KSB1 bacterium]|nr:lamin tail domain-containing protein [candidate division KSB1 bacterium]